VCDGYVRMASLKGPSCCYIGPTWSTPPNPEASQPLNNDALRATATATASVRTSTHRGFVKQVGSSPIQNGNYCGDVLRFDVYHVKIG
jgi:hypothetical protein